ncbi:Elongator subunit elp6 [Spiromyces aspiralis]|uniref:Elongator subunit elp6 n=1 Tax=Spiromyces aspiralis TaxID=68401 RepID=A0ACC1HG23_9FUNG|nr:Elongator subunit elp6 [Spiromyces aspiralis]
MARVRPGRDDEDPQRRTMSSDGNGDSGTLGAALKWPAGLPPPDTLTLITDTISAPGQFLIANFTATALKLISAAVSSRGEPSGHVILLSFCQIFNHYHQIALKLGVNLGAAKAAGTFSFIDGLTKLADYRGSSKFQVVGASTVPVDSQPSTTVPAFPVRRGASSSDGTSLATSWVGGLLQEIESRLVANGGPTPSSLSGEDMPIVYMLIDDITVLMDIGAPLGVVQSFVHACRTLVSKHGGSLIVLTHADEPIRGEYGEPIDPVAGVIGYLHGCADYILQLEGLASGRSRDVSGQLIAARGPLCASESFQPIVLHYSIHEKGARFFAPGASQAVL